MKVALSALIKIMTHTTHSFTTFMSHLQLALFVDEILQVVLSFLPNYALARAARTCKAWKDPALDVLWRDIRVFDLLGLAYPIKAGAESIPSQPVSHVMRLPSELPCISDPDPAPPSKTEPRVWDVASLRALAPKVHTGRISSIHSLDRFRSLINELVRCLNNYPILPNLRTLSVTISDDPSMITSFLSLSMTTLTIAEGGRRPSGQAIRSLFVDLGTNCPDLTTLSIRIRLFPSEGDQASMFISTLQNLPGLRDLSFEWVAQPGLDRVVQQVSTLPTLKAFSIKASPDGYAGTWTWHRNSLASPVFAVLRHLCIGYSTTNLDELLGDVSSELQKLMIGEMYGRETIVNFGAVIRVLPRFANLRVFDACVTDVNGRECVSRADFLSFRHCTSLKVLHLNTRSTIKIDDYDLKAVLSHLPHLTSFRIHAASFGTEPSDPDFTLQAISYVIILCPLIESIHLRIDARDPPTRTSPPPPDVRPAQFLREICVQDSLIQEPGIVARYLAPWIARADCHIHVEDSPVGSNVDWKAWKRVDEWTKGLVRDRRLYGGA